VRVHPKAKRSITLLVSVCTLLVGMSVVASTAASATTKASAKGSAAWCGKHPKKAICRNQTGGSGSGTGVAQTSIVVTAAPNPLVETGQSEIRAVIEVETNPSLAGDTVDIESSQLAATCGGAVLFGSQQGGAVYTPDSVQVALDDDGNVTVNVYGIDCAPGDAVIAADLVVAPYYSAVTTLDALAPVVTTAGVTGDPNNEVETNDGGGGSATVYDSTTTPLPPDMPASEGFECCGNSELGNQISFSGTARQLNSVVVTMDSWGCGVTGGTPSWYPPGPTAGLCVTTPGTTFSEPITLNIYNVGPANAVGSLIATTTETFNIPFRPSSDPTQCSGANRGLWYDAATNTCNYGLAVNETFTFPNVTLPNAVIYGIAYNTSTQGYHPYGTATACFTSAAGCGYDSLNVGLTDADGPTVGSDPLPGTWYWNNQNPDIYAPCTSTPDVFSLFTDGNNPSDCLSDGTNLTPPYNPYYIPAVQFNATVPINESDVYTVFYVETDPVYAEQTVEIDSAQLADRCAPGTATWISNNGSFTGSTATAVLDDDGNATFAFTGSSCAAGDSAVIADVLAGSHLTYTTTYTILPPQPTI
jgi:hypothetical protein